MGDICVKGNFKSRYMVKLGVLEDFLLQAYIVEPCTS